MTLINSAISSLATGVNWGIDHTGGPLPFTLAASALCFGAVVVFWRLGHPFPGVPHRPLGMVNAQAPSASTLLAHQLAEVQPTAPVVLTSSAIVASNVGDDKRTAYDTVGPAAIAEAVRLFYQRVINDPDLAPYFTNVDMSRLHRHQALFIGQLWGGPVHFELERLVSAHRHLNITSGHYWRVVGHLLDVLTSLEVPAWVVLFTMGALYDVHRMVIHEDDDPSSPTMTTVITEDDDPPVPAECDPIADEAPGSPAAERHVHCGAATACSRHGKAECVMRPCDHTGDDGTLPAEPPSGRNIVEIGFTVPNNTRTFTTGGPGSNSPSSYPGGAGGSC